MSIFELPKLAHPDFTLPGVKPKDKVEIDWDNPITKGLIAYWSLQDLDELVKGQRLTNSGCEQIKNGYDVGDGTSDILTSNGWFALNGINFCTGIIRTKPFTVADNGTAFSARRSTTGNSRFYIGRVGEDLRFTVGNTFTTGGTVAADIEYTLAVERDGSNANGWQNGVKVAGPTAVTFDGIGSDFFLGIGNYSPVPGNTNEWSGEYYWSGIWERKLSAKEHLALHLDPHQLVKPVVPIYWKSSAFTDFAELRQTILDGIDSDLSEEFGWDALFKTIPVSNVVRTDANTVTITIPALSTFDITALETITSTIPNEVLVINSVDVVGDITFTVDVAAAAAAGYTGALMLMGLGT